MNIYAHILVGLDLSSAESSLLVAQKAAQIARTLDAKLSLLHVVEPIAMVCVGDFPVDLSSTQIALEEQAKTQMAHLVAKLGGDIYFHQVTLGDPATELRITAETIKADLLIVGSHGRHGFASLLGSTAADVLANAHYDVLAVRI
jgi:universal stress protein A